MENKNYRTVGTFPISYRKTVERGTHDTPNNTAQFPDLVQILLHKITSFLLTY